MYEYAGYIKDISKNYKGENIITFATDFTIGDLVSETGALTATFKKYRKARSLDANSYCWVLCTKIGNKLRKSKEEVYIQMLKDYGQSEIVSVLADINVKGFFKYYEPIGQGYTQGKCFTHYKIYKGSSEYDSKEMSILLDGIVQEAQELGIETRPPEEIERLASIWNQ